MIGISKIKFNRIMIILTTLIYMLMVFSIGYFLVENYTIDIKNKICIIGLLGWGLLIWSIVSWKRLTQKVICVELMFFLIGYIFVFGQSLLAPLSLVSPEKDLFFRVDPQIIPKAQIYTLLCMGFYHIGSIIGFKYQFENNNKYYDQEKMKRAIKIVGYILFLISIIPFLIKIYTSISVVVRYGYLGIYNFNPVNTGLNAIFENIGQYFIPALICLLIAYVDSPYKRKIIMVLFSINILVTLFLGSRAGAVILIIVFICVYHYCIKPIKGKNILLYAIGGYILLSILAVIGNTRELVGRDITAYIESFLNSFGKDNLVLDSLSEMGSSMFPLIKTMELVPGIYPYRFGSTYLYAFTSVIPNIGIWDIHPAMVNANLGDWLMKVLSMSYGPGYSLVAESYINFGSFGWVIFLLQGCIYSKIFSSVDKNTAKSKMHLLCCILIFFNGVIMTTRNSFISTVRVFFYFVIPIYLLIRLIYNSLIKSKK